MMTGRLRPFFPYYGSKFRDAPRYQPPRHPLVIEPFAGAAGYSVRHNKRKVLLCDADPIIAGLWRFLIGARPDDILSLPDLADGQTTDDIDAPTEARHLIGFWLNPSAEPAKSPGAWMRSSGGRSNSWGAAVRESVASQLRLIRHWEVVHGSYADLPNMEATWFIDPPYQVAGWRYRHSSKGIDYAHLGAWSQSRKGQITVCEAGGADWLPFSPAGLRKTARNTKAMEAVWTNDAGPLFAVEARPLTGDGV